MKFSNKNKIILGSIIGVLIGTLMSVSYAFFTYANTGSNNQLITGNIWMRYRETNTLTLENAMPTTTYDATKKFQFTIDGTNTTTDKDVWYEIKVKRGDIPTSNPAKTESDRIPDRYIKYKLVKEVNNVETTVVDGDSWEQLNTGKVIYVDKIAKDQSNQVHNYTMYMWISDKLEIGTSQTADFTIANWNKAFASIKVDVTGDFTTKEVDEPYMTINAMNTFPTVITDQKSNIKEVYFNKMSESAMNTRYNAATIKADLTYNNEGKVLAWLETNTTDNTKYNLIVASDGETYLSTGYNLFSGFYSASKIEFKNINTSRVTSMNSMFSGCSSLQNIDLSDKGSNNLSYTGGMFSGCSSLKSINMANFNFGNVSSHEGIFLGLSNLENVNLENAKMGVFSAGGMFAGDSKLKYVNLSNTGSNNLTDAVGMFDSCTSLETVNMRNFNFGNTTTLYSQFSYKGFFQGLTNLEEVNLTGVTANAITDTYAVSSMFKNCSSLTEIDLSSFSVTNTEMFRGCTSLKTIDLSGLGVLDSNSNIAANLFYNLTALEKIYVSQNTDFSNQPSGMPIFGGDTNLVGGNGTHYSDDNPKDKTYAIIDGTNGQPGYFTDVADKPTT